MTSTGGELRQHHVSGAPWRLRHIPLSEGATGASTTEKTESFASSMSCSVNLPAFTQSTAFEKDCSVSVERGSLEDQRDTR